MHPGRPARRPFTAAGTAPYAIDAADPHAAGCRAATDPGADRAPAPDDDGAGGFVPCGPLRTHRSREYGMSNYRIDFAKEILGVPFTIGSVEIVRARDPERARRAAELRFARQHGLGDWRERADLATVATL